MQRNEEEEKETLMNQITHDNHYVPQFYLKQWSQDGNHIWTYQILVSNENVPTWKRRAIKGVAYLRDLYTEIQNNNEVDDFECWIGINFETPAIQSIQKVLKDNPLTQEDWDRLAIFVGSQDIRTPLQYLESMERWEKKLPKLLKTSLEKSLQILQRDGKLENQRSNSSSKVYEMNLEDILTIETSIKGDVESYGQSYIGASILAGRKLWIEQQRYLLSKTINVLKKHKWSILKPAPGYQWFTCDHPVVKLNYYNRGNYDLKGGWDVNGGNILMPLSPRHLLFTQIGEYLPDRIKLSSRKTKLFQEIIAKRALRWIFANEPLEIISKYRQRHVDSDIYHFEAKQWRDWHRKQLEGMKHEDGLSPVDLSQD